MIGGALGFLAAWVLFNTPYTTQEADFDDDGTLDERMTYEGSKLALYEFDRNGDGRMDLSYASDAHGVATTAEMDDDFDGKFEGRMRLVKNPPRVSECDRNGDGVFEEIGTYENGVLKQADFDTDADGEFDRRVEYDLMREPVK